MKLTSVLNHMKLTFKNPFAVHASAVADPEMAQRQKQNIIMIKNKKKKRRRQNINFSKVSMQIEDLLNI
jgi:hypothetical protein